MVSTASFLVRCPGGVKPLRGYLREGGFLLTNLTAANLWTQANQKEPFSSEDFSLPQTVLLRVSVAERRGLVGGRPGLGGGKRLAGWGQLARVCVWIGREQGEVRLPSTWW